MAVRTANVNPNLQQLVSAGSARVASAQDQLGKIINAG
jgi:hypothetical protein